MKRRTGEMCSKWPRRTVKGSRPKNGSVADNVWWCSPGLVYVRVLMFWACILVIDFLLEFRLELLWPLWLLLTSVYDSFKYQGLAFSFFFVCLSLSADFLCFVFIPVQWLFFAASTYVWVQYVWHTDRGICLPTICLWALFIYVEASIRLKDLKHFPAHLDLCRPFAAHCIGYPVVTLGFGIKGYVSYRIRQRKQREVAKENDFYYELLLESLPAEQQEAYHLRNSPAVQSTASQQAEEVATATLAVSNGTVASPAANNVPARNSSSSNSNSSSAKRDKEKNAEKIYEKKGSCLDFHEVLDPSLSKEKEKEKEREKDREKEREREREREKEKEKRSKLNNSAQIVNSNATSNAHIKQRNIINTSAPNDVVNTSPSPEHFLRLEADIKRLKADLQGSRQSEAELRSQLCTLTNEERSVRGELQQLQQDNDALQAKLHGLVSARQADKQNMATLEKRLQEERKCRLLLETQLANERRARNNEAMEASKTQRAKSSTGYECSESCRQRRKDLETEIQQLRREVKSAEERYRGLEMELQHLRRSQQAATPTQQQQQQQQLVSALSALQDKTTHLETSLSAETRIKLDLFSALGEAKRQLEQRESLLAAREREISELKAKVTEVLAVSMMPSITDASQLSHNLGLDMSGHGLSMGNLSNYLSPSPPLYQLSMSDFATNLNMNLSDLSLNDPAPATLTPPASLTPMRPFSSKLFNHTNGVSLGVDDSKANKTGLDPNATVYTPKTMGNGEI